MVSAALAPKVPRWAFGAAISDIRVRDRQTGHKMAGAVEAVAVSGMEAGADARLSRASAGFASVSSQIIRRLRIDGVPPVAGAGN